MAGATLKGPIKSVLYIHNAILKETQEFEALARELNREDKPQIAALLERFKFFHQVLKIHEGSEEQGIFPHLEKRYKYIAATYDFDHSHHASSYARVEETIAAIGQARFNQERADLGRTLKRQSIVLNVVMELHVAKENELLYPVYDQLFTPEEQRAHEQQIMAHMPPPDVLARLAVWIFKAQSVADREGFVRVMMGMLPPAHLPGMMKLMAGGVSPQEWQAVVQRIPELKPI